MTQIKCLLAEIKKTKDCKVLAPAGLPKIRKGHTLPSDVKEFYTEAGGVALFENTSYWCEILAPKKVLPANPIIAGSAHEEDISSSWYTVAMIESNDYLTIDFNKQRLGRCYESFGDSHGVKGSCPIIAHSFTELLEQFIANKGKYWYWMQDGFKKLGDAYGQV